MPRFEYLTVHLPGETFDVADLNWVGAEGWLAFGVVPAALDGADYRVTDGVHVFLRREL